MKKIGIFLDEIKDQAIDDTQKFSKLGLNTGNMLFWHSLKTQLKLDVRSRWYIDHIDKLNLNEYKAFITTDLIWIRQLQDLSYLNKVLDVIGDLPLIPISIGLQCNSYLPDFKLHPETAKVLKRLSERCTMGVRGSYTAEILDKYGIKDFKVIGCPSMYLGTAGIDTVSAPIKPINNVSVNFETFYSKLSPAKIDFLLYCAERGYEFVEQTQVAADSRHIPDAEKLRQIESWLSEKKHCFFDIAQWREYMRKFDFSMGTRFHGNVLALWENIPALFLTCDSRTRELCEHFSLPMLDINDFDRSKPIEHYYEMADYERFHKRYPQRLREWEEFLEMNGIMDDQLESVFPKFCCKDSVKFREKIHEWKQKYNTTALELIKFPKKECSLGSIEEIKEGQYGVTVDGIKINCLFHKGNVNKLYVILGGGIGKNTSLPHYERWSYYGVLDGSVLVIEDPMYNKYFNKGLCVGWYYGQEASYIKEVQKLVEKTAKLIGVDQKKIVCYGSSAGGYAALYLSAQIGGAKCIAINPQINLKIQRDWNNAIEMEKITGHDLSADDARNDLLPVIKNSKANRIVLIENVESVSDMNQIKYLCTSLGVDFSYGLNRLSDKMLLWAYDALPIDAASSAHNAQELRSCIYSILGLLDIDIEYIDEYKKIYLSISLMWSELYKRARDCRFWMDKAEKLEKKANANTNTNTNDTILRIVQQIADREYYQSKVNTISLAQTEAFAKYKNIHKGQDVALIGTGPSLDKFIPMSDCAYCGVNKAFKYKKVLLNYLFMVDYNATKGYIREAEDYPCAKFYGLARDKWEVCLIPESIAISAKAARYYLEGVKNPIHFTLDICNEPLGDSGSVIFSAMQFLLWTNPKRIYLVGCDCTRSGYFGDGGFQTKDRNDTVYNGWCAMKKFAQLYYPDTEIISVNPVGLRGIFRDLDQNPEDASRK